MNDAIWAVAAPPTPERGQRFHWYALAASPVDGSCAAAIVTSRVSGAVRVTVTGCAGWPLSAFTVPVTAPVVGSAVTTTTALNFTLGSSGKGALVAPPRSKPHTK